MAQGNFRAFRSGSAASAMAGGYVRAVEADDAPLAPTLAIPTAYFPAALSGQHLAGTGALVWEGECLERDSRPRSH